MSDAAGAVSGATRTLVLAVLAVGGLGALAFDHFSGGSSAGPGGTPAPAGSPSPAVVVLPGAPPGDLASLRQRYRPIVLKGPFKERDFKDRPAPKPRETGPRDETPREPPKPGDLSLRLTSLMGAGAARVGLLEDRSSGTAIFAQAGFSLGELSVASVGSESLMVTLSGKERELSIGDSLTLPASAKAGLKPLRPAGSVTEERKPVSGSSKLPELSEDKKLSILERLKRRRQASMQRAGEAPEEAGGEAPKQGEAGEPKAGEPKAGEPKAGEPKAGEPAADDPTGPEGPNPGEQPGGGDEPGPDGPDGPPMPPMDPNGDPNGDPNDPNSDPEEPENPSDSRRDEPEAPPEDEPTEPPSGETPPSEGS